MLYTMHWDEKTYIIHIYYTSSMETVYVNVRFPKADVEMLDRCVAEGKGMSRSDLVRYAVRRLCNEKGMKA
jgi:metal-responsive CopG/Arc/MetJ family transcriptional regulator